MDLLCGACSWAPRRDPIRLTAICTILLAAGTACLAQTSTTNTGWYQYFGDHPLGGPWTLHAEGQWRRDDLIVKWEQLLLRTGLGYEVNPHLQVSVGYTYLRTFDYGEIRRTPSREHRIYEEAEVTHPTGRIDWTHRFRLEQRFMADESDSKWEFAERVRYRMQAKLPLFGKTVKKSKLYASLYDEVFVRFGPHGGPQAFDQNRVYGALGVPLSKNNRIEVGYQYRYYPQSTGVLQEEHSLIVSLFSKSDLFRKK